MGFCYRSSSVLLIVFGNVITLLYCFIFIASSKPIPSYFLNRLAFMFSFFIWGILISQLVIVL